MDGRLGVLNETTLLVILVALLLLLSRVGRCVRGVATPVVRVVAQHLEERGMRMVVKRIRRLFHLLVVLGLLHLLNLVDASLAGSGNACKIDGNVVAALTVDPGRQRSVGGVEGERVDEGAAGPLVQLGLS